MDSGVTRERASPKLAIRPFLAAGQFHGRSTRTEVVSFWVLGWIFDFIKVWSSETPGPLMVALAVISAFVWTWPWLPLLVRRLHDQDLSGWFAAIPMLFPMFWVFEWFFGLPGDSYSISLNQWTLHLTKGLAWTPISVAGWVVSILALIVLLIELFSPGTPGSNRFGADPRRSMPD